MRVLRKTFNRLRSRLPHTDWNSRADTLGTRQSVLATWQANWVAAELTKRGCQIEMVPITTTGDVSEKPLGEVGGQGLFTKEIQRALLDHRCDLAVHSLKDLPTEPVEGLMLVSRPRGRGDWRCADWPNWEDRRTTSCRSHRWYRVRSESGPIESNPF